jgi:HEAT repeat protein
LGISACRERLLELGNTAVPTLIPLLNSKNPGLEIEAMRLLVQIGDNKGLAAVLGKILTVKTDDSCFASYVDTIADCKSAAIAQWLTAYLGKTQKEETRQRVLTILAALRGPDVVEHLADAVENPADNLHHEDCAIALASLSDPSHIDTLREILEESESSQLRTIAAYGLASVGNSEACSVLLSRASSGNADAKVCRDALASVQSTYGQETLIAAAGNQALPVETRSAVIQALAGQNSPRVQTTLANIAQDVTDTSLQTQISQVLTPSRNEESPERHEDDTGETWASTDK